MTATHKQEAARLDAEVSQLKSDLHQLRYATYLLAALLEADAHFHGHISPARAKACRDANALIGRESDIPAMIDAALAKVAA